MVRNLWPSANFSCSESVISLVNNQLTGNLIKVAISGLVECYKFSLEGVKLEKRWHRHRTKSSLDGADCLHLHRFTGIKTLDLSISTRSTSRVPWILGNKKNYFSDRVAHFLNSSDMRILISIELPSEVSFLWRWVGQVGRTTLRSAWLTKLESWWWGTEAFVNSNDFHMKEKLAGDDKLFDGPSEWDYDEQPTRLKESFATVLNHIKFDEFANHIVSHHKTRIKTPERDGPSGNYCFQFCCHSPVNYAN